MNIETKSEVRLQWGPESRGSDGAVPAVHRLDWAERWPWLTHGVTCRGEAPEAFDLALFGAGPSSDALDRWGLLAAAVEMPAVAHSRQPHQAEVRVHGPLQAGLHLADPADAHVTGSPGVLLGVTVADCVPILLVCPAPRVVGVVHAGWRGVVAGVLESTLAEVERRFGVDPADVHLHFGPAICGRCYEVGPEVHQALGGPTPDAPRPVDLRDVLWRRAVRAGVPEENLGRSGFCTLCSMGSGRRIFFSHRGGDRERQVAWVGIRSGAGAGR